MWTNNSEIVIEIDDVARDRIDLKNKNLVTNNNSFIWMGCGFVMSA